MTATFKQTNSPVWHPFTQAKTSPAPLKVKRGYGATIELEDGRQIIDCISSWWVNLHGHAHPVIAQAISEQAKKLEHVIFAGFTHEPAEQFARQLLTHLPESLSRVFYSDNGSTSVEVALKMAYQYWHNQGQTRSRFIAFEGAYHGDTLGAMSAGRSSPFWQPFKSIMCAVDLVPFPSTFQNDPDIELKEENSIATLRNLIESNPDQHAAIIIEPLVQGAGGMHMCRPEFLGKLETTAAELGVLLIYDEVMTGFGRTGDWFACTKSNTAPDIICLSKGITGGFMPLAVTVATEKIYQAFYSDDNNKTFFHGHSYTANPLACAAAIASLELLEHNPNMFMSMEKLHNQFLYKWLIDSEKVEKIRICGTIAAFDIASEDKTDYFNTLGPTLRQKFLDLGFLIRPLGNTIYLMPPYCITPDELESAYEAISKVACHSLITPSLQSMYTVAAICKQTAATVKIFL